MKDMVSVPKRRLQIIKEITETFLQRHYPDEMALLPITWQRFLDFRNKTKTRQRKGARAGTEYITWGLTFADIGRVKLVGPLVILTMYQTLEELAISRDRMSVPTIGQLETAVRTCAQTFEASPQLVSQMVSSLPSRLHRMLSAEETLGESASMPSRKQVVRVRHDGQIRIDDGEPFFITPAQAATVFCELIREGHVHWLDGTVLFDAWARKLPKDPLKAFSGEISKASGILKMRKVGLLLVPEKGPDGHAGSWQLRVAGGTQLNGTVVEAQRLVVGAESALSANHLAEAVAEAAAAFDLDPTNIAAATLVLRTGPSHDLEAAHVERLKASLRTVQKFNRNAAGASKILSKVAPALKNRWWADIETFQSSLTQRNQELLALCRVGELILKEGRYLTEEESQLLALDVLVHQVRKAPIRSKGILSKDIVRLIEGSEIVLSVLRVAGAGCHKLFRLTPELWETLPTRLARIFQTKVCRAKRSPLDYKSVEHLKGAWVLYLRREAVEEMIEKKLGIEKPLQKDMRKLMRAVRGRDKRDINTADICRQLHWEYYRWASANAALNIFFDWQNKHENELEDIDAEEYRQRWRDL